MASLIDKLLKRKAAGTEKGAGVGDIDHRASGAYADGDFDLAIRLYDQVILADPSRAEVYYKRGNALKNTGEAEAAIRSYDLAIERDPNHAYAYCNRGVVQQALGLSTEALASYERAIALDPSDAVAHYNRALLQQELYRWDEALVSYDLAVAANPQFADARYNRAVAMLFLGDFERGWQEFEWRWQNAQRLGIGESRDFTQPLWLGAQSLTGKSILLHSEGGLGDTIQFSRYASLAAERGATTYLEVQPPLVGLLGTLDGVSRVIARGDVLPEFDFQCPLMSLPLAFRTNPSTIPAVPGYIRGDAGKIEHWRSRLGKAGQPRVGLVWSGNPKNPIDQRRTVRLAEWISYLPAGFDFFCLQKDLRDHDLSVLRASPLIRSFGQELDFPNTAALCECMDIVVSVDTSVAHLSAALGRPTWLLLAAVPDWRWMRDREDTPWYPGARLYRQRTAGDWRPVFERIAGDLRKEFGISGG